MGADFMFTASPRCELTRERKERIKDTIRLTSDEDLMSVVYDYMPFGLYDEPTPDEIRLKLYRAVLEVAEIENRETSNLRLTGMDWVANITGGMSWGDSPTESFDLMSGVTCFDSVYNLMVEFSREDLVIINNRIKLQQQQGGADGT